MKCLIFVVLFALSGCGSIIQGSGTIIGIKVGLPKGADFVVGYQRYDLVICEDTSNIDVGLRGTVNAEGIKGRQHAKFGTAATPYSEDVQIVDAEDDQTIDNEFEDTLNEDIR